MLAPASFWVWAKETLPSSLPRDGLALTSTKMMTLLSRQLPCRADTARVSTNDWLGNQQTGRQ